MRVVSLASYSNKQTHGTESVVSKLCLFSVFKRIRLLQIILDRKVKEKQIVLQANKYIKRMYTYLYLLFHTEEILPTNKGS